MIKSTIGFMVIFTVAVNFAQAQSLASLRQDITKILEDKAATVGVAVWGMSPQDTLSINGNQHLPMQSVFKYHLALAVLHQVDQGKLSLDQEVSIDKKQIELYSHLYSPLREKYPDGATITLAEIIQYTVALSDNLGCDLLFELVGGPEVVQSYLHQIGINDIVIVHTEIVMQADWDRQYENWTTANAANQALQLFYENANNLLSTDSYNFLLEVLKGTKTGVKSIRGLLPEDAVVAHKTGYSGENEQGVIGALNNIGIIFLPEGGYCYVSVLVSNSSEGLEASQKIIAEVAKLAWDYFNK